MRNVKITGTGIYIPSNKVYNEDIDAHFEKRGLNAHNLMEHLGRRKRYFISEGENAISMSCNAIENCIKKNNIDLSEVELLIFCSDTPEYLTPSNAMKIVGLYGDKMKNVQMAFDVNSNCTSMIQGLDIASKYMKADGINKALVIGCFCISPATLWSDTVVYANFADAAACVALHSEENEIKCGILDTKVTINAALHEYVTYPKCGMSQVPLKRIEPNQKRLEWNPFSLDALPQCWTEMITDVLKRNSYTPEDVDYYIFSQLSDKYNMDTLDLLHIPENKYHFVGREYGYTGNTCPVLCLNRMWDVYSKPGNIIIFCTIGAGAAMIVQLYKF
ncbi:MAG: hypothetical protein LUH14_11805 [Clostridiaceae bacterium]|nr:hypothetical protein [Clostridiaceae bacterium]